MTASVLTAILYGIMCWVLPGQSGKPIMMPPKPEGLLDASAGTAGSSSESSACSSSFVEDESDNDDGNAGDTVSSGADARSRSRSR